MKNIHKFYFISSIVLFVFLLKYISPKFIDSDTYFILATGREIIKNGIPFENPFHITEGLQIVIQQWLYCVMCYGVYCLGGFGGLFLLTILLTVLNGMVYWKIARLKGMDGNLAGLLILLFFILYSEYITVRPTNVTTFLLLLQIFVVEQYVHTHKWNWLLWLSVIMLVEANMHIALWFMHVLFMLPYIVPPFQWKEFKFAKNEYNVWCLIIATIGMVFATLLNPYGVQGVLYLVNSYTSELQNAGIGEMQPTSFMSSLGIMLLYGVVIIAVAISKNREISSPFLYLFFGTYILGMISYRNNVYFSLSFILVLFEILAHIDFLVINNYLTKIDIRIYVLLFLLAGYGVYGAYTGYYEEKDSLTTPSKAVEYLETNAEKTDSIFTEFNSGAYMEWNGYRVYMEARPELYFMAINKKEDIFQEYFNIISETSAEAYHQFDCKYNFQYYLVNNNNTLVTHLSYDSRFDKVLETDEYQLWKRN